MASTGTDGGPPSPSPSQLPPIPSSPTFTYASTANRLSSYNLPLPPPPRPPHAVLTKADLEASQTAYTDLLSTAKTYRQALAALSSAASSFGSSLEACARLKESTADALGPPGGGGASLRNSFTSKGNCTADLLMAASGVQHLVANHQQILSETVYRSFEVPLLHELDKWRATMDDEAEGYKREAAARSREITRLEKEGLRLHRQRRRDVGQFREHLVDLTSRLDGLTTLHGEHARTMLRESQETSVKIRDASCSLVRAEVDIFESLARKGWAGGGLDELLEQGHDLFASDEDSTLGGTAVPTLSGGAAGEGAKLFSILPPKSILADAASDSSRQAKGGGGHGRADSLLVETERYQSLAGAVGERDKADADSIFSDFNQSRGVRPFSPQPIRRSPTDLVLDPDRLPHEQADKSGGGTRDPSPRRPGGPSEEDEAEEDILSPWRGADLQRASSGDTSDAAPPTKSTRDTSNDNESPTMTDKEGGRRWSVTNEEVRQ